MIKRMLLGAFAVSLSLLMAAPAAAQAPGLSRSASPYAMRLNAGHAHALADVRSGDLGGTRDASTPSADLGSYYPVGPARVLDTRHGIGGFRKPVGAHSSLAVQVASEYGVPAGGVTAVVLNVTAVRGTKASYVTVYPDGKRRPPAGNLDFTAHEVTTNLVTVPVGTDGKVRFYNNLGQVNLVADLAGYYLPGTGGSLLSPVGPVRVLDTLTGTGVRKGKVGPGQSLTLKVTGRHGVPAVGVSAVVLNVTAANATRASHVTVYPGGTKRPQSSNLSFARGDTFSSLVIVPVNSTGTVTFYNHAGSVDLVAGLSGYFAGYFAAGVGAQFDGVGPVRVLDTLTGTGVRKGKVGPGQSVTLKVTGSQGVAATGVSAVVLNVTALKSTRAGYVTVYPGPARPPTWNLNFEAGKVVPNLVVVPVSANGTVSFYNHAGSVDLIADLVGYYYAGSAVPYVLSGGSYGFSSPMAVAFDGTHLWITNYLGYSVTEVNASDGSWVRTLSGGSYAFAGPDAVAFDGTHLWIVNNTGQSVTEVNASDGSWVRTLSGGSYGFNYPWGIAFDGTHLWITNGSGESVTEVNAADGSWVRTLSGGNYGFNQPGAIAFDGTHLWIAEAGADSVTELNASDGSWVRTLSNGTLIDPDGFAFDGTHLWTTDSVVSEVTEFDASDGSWVNTLGGGSYGLDTPMAITFDGTHLWIANGSGPGGGSVTEVNASDGSWVRTLSGSSYKFSEPDGLAFDGTHLWITNNIGNSVTVVRT